MDRGFYTIRDVPAIMHVTYIQIRGYAISGEAMQSAEYALLSVKMYSLTGPIPHPGNYSPI